MREHVGLSLTEAAALHHVDTTAISNSRGGPVRWQRRPGERVDAQLLLP
ncbi:hypothetical protein ACH4L7_25190 [Streptomyces anulatus]